jgi:hypothetical protein
LKKVLNRDDKEIGAAKIIFFLFQNIAEYMQSKYINKNIFYLAWSWGLDQNISNTKMSIS